ncbi:MAG: hypothetical protein IJX28_03845 [Clostridia bacterium]|nr:hypothetical protein [Clostridia bacterium]
MNILSFGEIIWDVYPEAATLGGAPLNFAAHAALQGSEVTLLSCVGEDDLGKRALEEIAALGLSTHGIGVSAAAPTGQCTVTLNAEGLPTYRIAEASAYDVIPASINAKAPYDALAFGTLALRKEHNRRLLAELIATGGFGEIFTDLNIRPPFYSSESVEFCLSHATILKVSDEELPTVTRLVLGGQWEDMESAQRLATRYPNLRLVLITKGEQGALCYDRNEERFHACPAEPTHVLSTVGAGDSFGATFLTHYHATGDIPAALHRAARVSAFVVAHKEAIPKDTPCFLNIL